MHYCSLLFNLCTTQSLLILFLEETTVRAACLNCLESHSVEFSLHLADGAKTAAGERHAITTDGALDTTKCPDSGPQSNQTTRYEPRHAVTVAGPARYVADGTRQTTVCQEQGFAIRTAREEARVPVPVSLDGSYQHLISHYHWLLCYHHVSHCH